MNDEIQKFVAMKHKKRMMAGPEQDEHNERVMKGPFPFPSSNISIH
jgi:hypothetical protein